MKKRENDITRLKNLLTHNKFCSDDKFETLFYSDLRALLSDYFAILGEPLICIEKKQSGFGVNITFNAEAIKKVNSIND